MDLHVLISNQRLKPSLSCEIIREFIHYYAITCSVDDDDNSDLFANKTMVFNRILLFNHSVCFKCLKRSYDCFHCLHCKHSFCYDCDAVRRYYPFTDVCYDCVLKCDKCSNFVNVKFCTTCRKFFCSLCTKGCPFRISNEECYLFCKMKCIPIHLLQKKLIQELNLIVQRKKINSLPTFNNKIQKYLKRSL